MRDSILHGDCLEILKDLKDESFDHCITDPPYNITGYDFKKEIGWYKSNKTWRENKKFNKISENWDTFNDKDYLEFTVSWLTEIQRVVKRNGNILIFGTYHNIYKIGFILELLDIKINNSIIWYKRNAFPNITQRLFCESTEQIVWGVNNSKKYAKNWIFNYKDLKELTENKKQMRNMWDIPMTRSCEKKFGKHPSQKPMEVITRLVLGCTNPGNYIIDPFSGSGTTPLVAKLNNRHYLGIESDDKFYNLSIERIKNHLT